MSQWIVLKTYKKYQVKSWNTLAIATVLIALQSTLCWKGLEPLCAGSGDINGSVTDKKGSAIACWEITQSTWLCLTVKILKLQLSWLIMPEGKPCIRRKKKRPNFQNGMLIFYSSLTTLPQETHWLAKSTIAAQNALFFPNKMKWQRLHGNSHFETSLPTRFNSPTIGRHGFQQLFISLGLLHLQSGPLQNRKEDVDRICALVALLAGRAQQERRGMHL